MIIDLTKNGGGIICYQSQLLDFLFPEVKKDWLPTDMVANNQTQELVRTAIAKKNQGSNFYPSAWTLENGTTLEGNNTEWIIPGYQRRCTDSLKDCRTYSDFIHLGKNQCGTFPVPEKHPFKPKRIAILTHGYCGSSCMLFATKAHLFANVRTVVVQALPGSPQQFGSFVGGQVMDGNALYNELWQLGKLGAPGFPNFLPTTSAFRFAFREAYTDINATIPVEYVFQGADYYLPRTFLSAIKPENSWIDVIRLMNNEIRWSLIREQLYD